jgi:glycosyltransferase involved in cell wall biosynthesis
MKLSVIIPCYNAAQTISVQLDALVDQRWEHPWEVVVVNNNSTDDSIRLVRSYEKKVPHLRIVEASEKQNSAYAANVGASMAAGESIAFCDADDEMGQGWIMAMGNALADYDFVACKIDTRKLNQEWVYNALGGHAQNQGLQTMCYPPYFPHAGAGTLGIKRWIHDQVGGFDETLPYVQDTDYCVKVQRYGVKLHYVARATMHVRLRDSVAGIFRQARNWSQYNVTVYKRYRFVNGPDLAHPWLTYCYRWIFFLRLLRRIGDRTTRAQVAWVLGYQIGLLYGICKERVPPVHN